MGRMNEIAELVDSGMSPREIASLTGSPVEWIAEMVEEYQRGKEEHQDMEANCS